MTNRDGFMYIVKQVASGGALHASIIPVEVYDMKGAACNVNQVRNAIKRDEQVGPPAFAYRVYDTYERAREFQNTINTFSGALQSFEFCR